MFYFQKFVSLTKVRWRNRFNFEVCFCEKISYRKFYSIIFSSMILKYVYSCNTYWIRQVKVDVNGGELPNGSVKEESEPLPVNRFLRRRFSLKSFRRKYREKVSSQNHKFLLCVFPSSYFFFFIFFLRARVYVHTLCVVVYMFCLFLLYGAYINLCTFWYPQKIRIPPRDTTSLGVFRYVPTIYVGSYGISG